MFKLIIADDEITIRQGLTELVSSFGLDLTVAGTVSNGEAALVLAQEQRPELLLVDINMPRLNGLDFVERITAQLPESKIIIISGYDQFEYAQRALKLGVFDYLLKPLNRSILYNTLRAAMHSYAQRSYELNMLNRLPELSLSEEESPGARALRVLQAEFADPELTLTSLAERFHVSTTYLSRCIKQKTNRSFSDYLTSLRMERAIALLSSSESVLIYSIADQVGYSSQHYFCRMFKEYTGYTPSEYRRRLLQNSEPPNA